MTEWPSTTRILRDAGLYGGYDYQADVLMLAAMRRGRLVDGACCLLADGKTLEPKWQDAHPECFPYIHGYIEFLREHKVALIKAQPELRHEAERYVGHPDQLLMLDGEQSIIDIKTGGLPPSTALQTASYQMALNSMGERWLRRYALQLPGDGTYKLVPYRDPRDKDEFTILVRAWWIKSKYVEME